MAQDLPFLTNKYSISGMGGILFRELRTPRPDTETRDGPTRNFHENAEERPSPPRPEILDSQNLDGGNSASVIGASLEIVF